MIKKEIEIIWNKSLDALVETVFKWEMLIEVS